MKPLKFGALLLTAVVFLAACEKEEPPVKPAEEVVQEAILNSSNYKSGTFEIELSGDLQAPETEVGGKSASGSFEFELAGGFDEGQRDNPKMFLEFDAAVDADGKKQSGTGELRLIGSNFYFVLEKIKGIDETTMAFVKPFLGKWWNMPLPEDVSEQFNFYSGDESEMTVEEKAAKDLFEQTRFFKDPKYVEAEKVDGEKSYRYELALDKDAVVEYIQKVEALAGAVPDEKAAPLPDINEILEKVDFTGEMWVSKENMTMKQLSGTITTEVGELKLRYTIDDLGEAVEVVAPADSKVFDPMALLGGAGGGF